VVSAHALGPPPDIALPFFSYGLFKPGELPYRQIERFVDGSPVAGTVKGLLVIRDGLPLLKQGGGGEVPGYLIKFKSGAAAEAYGPIAEFEPRTQYTWKTISLVHRPSPDANVLVGKSPDKGSVPFEGTEWSGADDPVLNEGLARMREVAGEYGSNIFGSAPPESFDWGRLFRLQMAYLFLWTIIERYAALAYGPRLEPMDKVRSLGQDSVFAAGLKEIDRRDRLFDSRDPTNSEELDPADPAKSAKYYFQVRSNLTHQGKGAWKDGEIIRQSLRELLGIVEHIVEHMRPTVTS
jgi:hypothetical protein